MLFIWIMHIVSVEHACIDDNVNIYDIFLLHILVVRTQAINPTGWNWFLSTAHFVFTYIYYVHVFWKIYKHERCTLYGLDNNKLNSKRYSKTNGDRYDGIHLFEVPSDWKCYATADTWQHVKCFLLSQLFIFQFSVCIHLLCVVCDVGQVNNIIRGSVDDVDERFRMFQ